MILLVASSVTSIAQFITVLIIFVAVLLMTYLVTRWVGGYQRGKMTGTNIEIIETVRIGQGKYIQVVRTSDKYLAIALGKDTVTMLAELDEETVLRKDTQINSELSFKTLFNKVRKKSSSDSGSMGDE